MIDSYRDWVIACVDAVDIAVERDNRAFEYQSRVIDPLLKLLLRNIGTGDRYEAWYNQTN